MNETEIRIPWRGKMLTLKEAETTARRLDQVGRLLQLIGIAGLVGTFLWRFLALLLVVGALSLPVSAFAQSQNFTEGLSAIGQAFGLTSQAVAVGQQAKTWRSQPDAYYQAGQPCYVQRGNQLYPGRFYPVENNGRTDTRCVETGPQP